MIEMKKNFSVFIMVFLFLIVGCTNTSKGKNNGVMIIDSLGREINLEEPPKKILIAGKQTPMLVNFAYLFENAQQNILAIENRSQSGKPFLEYIDPELDKKYSLEKGAGAEQIAPLNPDLVIIKQSMREIIGKQLEAIDIPIV